MTDLVAYEVGKPWPYPPPGKGMRAIIAPDTEAGLSLMLAAGCDDPTPAELAAARGSIRVAVLSSPPLAWIVVDAGKLSWDAPYSPALAGHAHGAEIKAGARTMAALPDTTRTLVDFALIDRGIIASLRAATLTRAWMRALAAAIEACPDEIERNAYAAAIARDQARWTTAAMLAAATIVERPGI